MGSDKSHFNVWLIVRDKVTRQCPQATTFEEKGEPKRIRTEGIIPHSTTTTTALLLPLLLLLLPPSSLLLQLLLLLLLARTTTIVIVKTSDG